jgi:hypothetical protein
VAVHLKVRKVKSLQIGHIDVGRHDLAALAHPLSEPNGHRSPTRADLEAAPARLDQVATSTGGRIKDLLQQSEPLILDLFAAPASESVARIATQSFTSLRRVSTFWHLSTVVSGDLSAFNLVRPNANCAELCAI